MFSCSSECIIQSGNATSSFVHIYAPIMELYVNVHYRSVHLPSRDIHHIGIEPEKNPYTRSCQTADFIIIIVDGSHAVGKTPSLRNDNRRRKNKYYYNVNVLFIVCRDTNLAARTNFPRPYETSIRKQK